MIQVAFEASV